MQRRVDYEYDQEQVGFFSSLKSIITIILVVVAMYHFIYS